ncbi:MAG TPA: glycoside hydrolase family 13 protein [Mycobacteriales bacterium]|nr:glycoside hydrolase family 13 protein [Mycobacteriales bacterium]
MTSQSAPWWRSAVFYEVYLRSFADGTGDGVGDLAGLRHRLPYLADLGVDALWITPFYPSPMVDHGYDVADPRGVDPLFGDLAAFDAMLADAHALGLKVTIDVVPNHTSDQHPWFRAALAAPPGSPERDRYLFRDGRGPDGAEPPNNWQSAFGGPAWDRVPDGQWYLHHFAPGQPDLDWRHPEVQADAEATLRFWLDRGVDGFRVDVAHGLVKDARLRDNPGVHRWGTGHGPETRYAWDQPETHEVYRSWRRLLDSYAGDRMAVGEVYLADAAARTRYVRPDELHLAFNFALLWAGWDAAALRDAVDGSLTASAQVGAATTWVLSSHDSVRHLTRYGGGEVGRRRARAAALLLLGLPGPAYLYQGEELGLPEVELPDEVLQDPVFRYTRGERRGRDGCRVPLPWSGDRPPYGFGASSRTWLPQPADWAPLTVEAQQDDPDSMLALYRAALATRRAEPALRGGTLSWLESPADVLAFARPGAGGEPVVVAVNLSGRSVPAPPGHPLLVSDPAAPAGTLPPDSAAWVRPPQ